MSERASTIKCCSVPISLVTKYGGVVDNHATSNPVISDEKRREGGNRIKTGISPCNYRFKTIYFDLALINPVTYDNFYQP